MGARGPLPPGMMPPGLPPRMPLPMPLPPTSMGPGIALPPTSMVPGIALPPTPNMVGQHLMPANAPPQKGKGEIFYFSLPSVILKGVLIIELCNRLINAILENISS